MLSLPDVTLCTAFSNCHELHALAADECLKGVKFGDIKIFSDDTCGRDYITKIPKFANAQEYARFFHYEMPARIQTSHVLIIQWDSWIINPAAWQDEFLNCDYVGAPWWYPEFNVGNSGFCLQSKRLMEFIASNEDEFPIRHPYDDVLCRQYQKRLPQFKWAPSQLAWFFAFERTMVYPQYDIFGFHGIFNFPRVMAQEDLDKRLDLASREPYITNKVEWREVSHLQLERGRN